MNEKTDFTHQSTGAAPTKKGFGRDPDAVVGVGGELGASSEMAAASQSVQQGKAVDRQANRDAARAARHNDHGGQSPDQQATGQAPGGVGLRSALAQLAVGAMMKKGAEMILGDKGQVQQDGIQQKPEAEITAPTRATIDAGVEQAEQHANGAQVDRVRPAQTTQQPTQQYISEGIDALEALANGSLDAERSEAAPAPKEAALHGEGQQQTIEELLRSRDANLDETLANIRQKAIDAGVEHDGRAEYTKGNQVRNAGYEHARRQEVKGLE